MDAKLLALIATIALATTMLFSSGQATQLQSDFDNFKSTHGKVYKEATEEAYRFAVFTSNMQFAAEHNAKKLGSTLGATEFADMTHEEFSSIYLGYKPKTTVAENVFEETNFKGSVNWVTAGKVSAVKNQGSCGSCWAFSTTGSAESVKAIDGGAVGDFSEQQLVDCAGGTYGNQGCNGGLMDSAFDYFKDHGICTESSYSYKGVDGTCADTTCTKDAFTVASHTAVKAKDLSALKTALDAHPVSVAVDASLAWQLYFGGVMASWECGSSLDHGVLAVGYDDSAWLVKNSWGASWGEKGYVRLAVGSDTCGLADQACFPVKG